VDIKGSICPFGILKDGANLILVRVLIPEVTWITAPGHLKLTVETGGFFSGACLTMWNP